MTFFPPDPEFPQQDETESTTPRWWQAPEDELPVLLPVSELVAVTDHVAIALVGIAVYSDGVQFRVERTLRRNGLAGADWNELCGAFMEHMPFGGRVDGRIRFGAVLADGEKVVADGPFTGGVDPMAEPEGHTLNRRQQGGGGGGSTFSSVDELWLWPLPPDGPIELVMQWPALGIDETHAALDVGNVVELAQQARPYWSD